MLSTTQLFEMSSETPQTRSTKKQSPIDTTTFANFLNSQTLQTSQPQSTSDDSPRDLETKNVQNRDKTSDKRSKNETQNTDDDTRTHSRKDGSTEAGRNSPTSSDSGTESASDTAMSVDGRENGIQPGASTEATVNAQSFSAGSTDSGTSSDSTSDSSDAKASTAVTNPTSSATAEAAATAASNSAATSDTTASGSSEVSPEEFQQLIEQLMTEADSSSSATTEEQTPSIKIAAKTIDTRNHLLQGNLNCADQNIMFDTGLAEHFVRLLTDQFDQLKQTSNDSDSGGQTAQATPADASAVTLTANSPTTTQTADMALLTTSQQASTSDTQAADNLNRIVQVVRSNLGQRQSQLTVRLDPPELGKMRLDVKMVDNNLNLTIVTETQEANQTLSQRMDTLRQNLEQNGINLTKVEVVTRSPDSQASQNQTWQQPGQQQSNQNGFSFNQQNQNDQPRQNFQSNITTTSNDDSETPVVLTGTTLQNKTVNLVA